jgi:hypothetical protein
MCCIAAIEVPPRAYPLSDRGTDTSKFATARLVKSGEQSVHTMTLTLTPTRNPDQSTKFSSKINRATVDGSRSRPSRLRGSAPPSS